MLQGAIDRLGGNLRFAVGLRGFLRAETGVQQARARIASQLASREDSFLDLAEKAIYQNPRSPYRRLLAHAGVELADLAAMVRGRGLEAALEELYGRGVYITFEELRGRRPVKRGSLEFEVKVSDFDNPLLSAFFQSRSSGSRSAGTRVFIDLRTLQREAEYVACLFDAHGILGSRPLAVWQRRPPHSGGLNGLIRFAKIGWPAERWFAQNPFHLAHGGWRGAAFLAYSVLVSYLAGKPFPWPKTVSGDQALRIARWMGEKKREGRPAVLDTGVSGATRVCIAARDNGIDIAGSVFRVGGEPLTPQRARAMVSVGASFLSRYQMVETGIISISCADPVEIDDMHVVSERFAVLTRDKAVGPAGESVPALVYTSLQPDCRMILLNAESGDYGRLFRRECRCSLGGLGYSLHVAGVHGYDKLTSEGVTFMGSELYRLVDEVLPGKFGGDPTDYQLVEEDEEGIPRVSLVISPRVGGIDEKAAVGVALSELRRHFAGPIMAAEWARAGTLRVVRREPYASGGRKVLPLHVIGQAQAAHQAKGGGPAARP